MDAGGMAIALVVSPEGTLLGTITDGDARRAILRSVRLDDPVEQVMHREPTTAGQGTARDELLRLMQQHGIEHIPIIDDRQHVVGLELLSDLIGRPNAKEHPVVIFAGGLGTRLRPLTNDTPKPLLAVGDRPLLEVLLEQLVEYGFRHVFIAVHYQAHRIQQRLGDGAGLGVRITYLQEPKPLGTVGAARLARQALTQSFLVVNGDLLTRLNFDHLLTFHQRQQFDLTLALKDYEVRIPYGVVRLADGHVCAIDEKPCKRWFVNAGIYVMEPSLLELIPEDGPYDMTDLIRAAVRIKRRVGGFPVHEYWLDIGRSDDYEEAQAKMQHWRAAASPRRKVAAPRAVASRRR